MWELWFKKCFAFNSNNILKEVMLWLKIILRWIFGLLCFILLFREKNKYLGKICKTLAKFNKKNEMMTRKTRRARRRCIIGIGEVNVIITYIILQVFVITK